MAAEHHLTSHSLPMFIFASIRVCMIDMLGFRKESKTTVSRHMRSLMVERSLAYNLEESWFAIDKSTRMAERAALDNKILKERGEHHDLASDKPRRIPLPRPSA
jgi:hypothetical protein